MLKDLYLNAKIRWNNFIHQENGDTNFISIIIILVVVMGLAGVFFAFRTQLITWFQEHVIEFFNTIS